VLESILASSCITSSRTVFEQNKPKVGQLRLMMVVDQDVRLTDAVNETLRQTNQTDYIAEIPVYDLDRMKIL
jgi:hypothetical protein